MGVLISRRDLEVLLDFPKSPRSLPVSFLFPPRSMLASSRRHTATIDFNLEEWRATLCPTPCLNKWWSLPGPQPSNSWRKNKNQMPSSFARTRIHRNPRAKHCWPLRHSNLVHRRQKLFQDHELLQTENSLPLIKFKNCQQKQSHRRQPPFEFQVA